MIQKLSLKIVKAGYELPVEPKCGFDQLLVTQLVILEAVNVNSWFFRDVLYLPDSRERLPAR
jgi:glutaredoxin-related protein